MKTLLYVKYPSCFLNDYCLNYYGCLIFLLGTVDPLSFLLQTSMLFEWYQSPHSPKELSTAEPPRANRA
jgi:hypothetical protein